MISVCMATYNGATYIEEQLQSILSQLTEHDEIIVSDDRSTDDTLSLVTRIAATARTPIHIIHHKGLRGYTANFQHALMAAHGDIIFTADQDDVWLPEKVRLMTQAIEAGAVMAISNAKVTNSTLHVTAESYFEYRDGVYQGLLANIVKCGYIGCCLCFTREVLQRALPFPRRTLLSPYDLWLILVAYTVGKVKVIQQPLILYRRHAGNTSLGGLNAHKSTAFRLNYRLYNIIFLTARALHLK